jgi:predicted polyphosphate/ATP-dependent NAD kinase
MDIDEDAFRHGSLSARLYGYLRVPYRTSLVQNLKMASVGGGDSVGAIAEDVVDKMEEGALYIVGPGTTTRAIAEELGLAKTLLGVDVVLNGELVASDANETQLLNLLEDHGAGKARIIITLIGGQGYLFGRGNQQISPRVIRQVSEGLEKPWDHIMVVSAKEKLYTMGSEPLRVDTGDPQVDAMLCGYVKVITGYNERAVRKVTC